MPVARVKQMLTATWQRRNPAPRRGLTLTEMLVVLTLLSTLVGALMVSLLVGQTSSLSAEAYVQVQQEARRAFDVMVKELREAGQVNNDVAIAEPGVQRLDFQVSRGYDAATCGGICWGTDDAAVPTGWVHYVIDTSDPDRARLVRCTTANRLDAMPAGFAGCWVLANAVEPSLANSAFVYDHASWTVTLKIQTSVSSSQLPGGSLGTAPLVTRVRLRNS
jgi:prepilin-type N-terminal cleavage/methylation domain-containing protein